MIPPVFPLRGPAVSIRAAAARRGAALFLGQDTVQFEARHAQEVDEQGKAHLGSFHDGVVEKLLDGSQRGKPVGDRSLGNAGHNRTLGT